MNIDGTKTIISQDGMLQIYSIQEADNVDASHPLKLKFYIDEGTDRVDLVKLNFSLEPFRAYSKGAASGGGSTVTSANNQVQTVTSASGGGYNDTTEAGGAHIIETTADVISVHSGDGQTPFSVGESGTLTGTVTLNNAGSHNHGINDGTQLASASGNPITWKAVGGHTHTGTVKIESHSHTLPMHRHRIDTTIPTHKHQVIIDPHTHDVTIEPHTHNVTVPSHTHDIVYGIYQGTTARGVTIKVNGVIVDNTGYNSDQSNIDITKYIDSTGWHEVELTSNRLGRINAGIYIKSFVTTGDI